jgi:uncharacterized repeat protein (TIGR01451 family)
LATTRASAIRRGVRITVSPAHRITVELDRGTGYTTVIPPFDFVAAPGQPPLPGSFRFGFAGTTGGATNIHEIRNVVVSTVSPDLNIVKSHTGNFTAGQSGRYTLQVSDAAAAGQTTGPITVTDHVPNGLTAVAASGTGWNCTLAQPTVTCTYAVAALEAGQAAPPITLDVMVGGNAGSSVSNTAQVSTPGDVNLGDNTSTDVATVTRSADLSVTKLTSTAAPNLGETVAFTVQATNGGPSDATAVVVHDPLPAGLELVSAAPAPGTSYDAAAGNWMIGFLPNGATSTLTLTATVVEAVAITNTATVDSPEPDPNTANNSASVALNAPPTADLAVTRIASTTSPAVNKPLTFTITAFNRGPDAATGVSVADSLPAELQFVSATPSAGSYDPPTGTWTIGALATGDSASLTLVSTPSQADTVTKSATIAGDQPDPDGTNNQASVSLMPSNAADLAVFKRTDTTTPKVGQDVTFTITASNTGPADAAGVVVNDALPSGLEFVSAEPSAGSYDPLTGIWMIGGLVANATATLSMNATPTQSGALVNIATISSPQPDPNPANNAGSSQVIASAVADLTLSKSAAAASQVVGQPVVFTITTTDLGPSDATGVVVNDSLPAGLQLVSATVSVGSFDPTSGTWSVGELASGASATLQLAATVSQTGAITNTATVHADQPDPDTSNNTSTATSAATPPQAVVLLDDSASTRQDTPVQIDVVADDAIPPGLGVQVQPGVQPAHGTVVCTPSGTCTYTPNRGYVGADTFTYLVVPSVGAQTSATVSVTVLPLPPTTSPMPNPTPVQFPPAPRSSISPTPTLTATTVVSPPTPVPPKAADDSGITSENTPLALDVVSKPTR